MKKVVESYFILKTAAIVDGIHTEVMCSAYQDRIFVVVSQFEKIGSLVSLIINLCLFKSKLNC